MRGTSKEKDKRGMQAKQTCRASFLSAAAGNEAGAGREQREAFRIWEGKQRKKKKTLSNSFSTNVKYANFAETIKGRRAQKDKNERKGKTKVSDNRTTLALRQLI